MMEFLVHIAGGQQPELTPTPNPAAPLAIELAMTTIESSSRNGQSFLKQQCLRRDGYRCVVTGDFDKVKTPNHLGPK
jgi:hypothetical protein